MSALTKRASQPDAIGLMEESVHLLRHAPAGTLAIYFAGCFPFVLGLLFFWAHMTWFAPSPGSVAWSALGLAGLFAVMKGAQAEFCTRLLAQRLGVAPASLTVRRFFRVVAVQTRVQAWGLLLVPLAGLLLVPFAWVYAYFQSATVAGDDPKAHEIGLAQAVLWPGQNLFALALFLLLSLFAAANLGATFYAIPWLANHVLGIENIFGFSGWWYANSTFLASVAALAWLMVDPLVKAFYTLRLFHGRSRRTGEDLRVELQLARPGSKALRVALVIACLFAGLIPAPRLTAAVTSAPARAVDPAQLDQAINDTLDGRDFQWRLRPTPTVEDASRDGPIKSFVREGAQAVVDFFRWIFRAVGRAIDWIVSFFPGAGSDPTQRAKTGHLGPLRVLLYLLLAAAVLLIVVFFVLAYGRGAKAAAVAARAVKAATPDLQDEATQAAQLPADGWLALAREQLARGDWRLALRALQLADLARLAGEGLVSLAKFKTNLDYERELGRRAVSRRTLVTRFSAHRRLFESVWYGRAQPLEGEVRGWLAELEQPLPE